MSRKKEVIKEEEKPKKSSNFYRITFLILMINVILFNVINIFLKSYVLIASIIFLFIIFIIHNIVKKMNIKFFKKLLNFIYIFLIIIFIFFNITANKASNLTNDIKETNALVKPVNLKSESFNILLTGVDTRNSGNDIGLKNSDAIMVASVNPKTKEVLLTSLPRDTYVSLACTQQLDKLTHASTFSDQCIVQTVENILDIEINYFINANFDAVIKAINTVGGINIKIEQDFCGQNQTDKKEAFCFKKGTNHLNGEEALSYARERKSFATGDYARIEHQQQVLEGFINSFKKHPLKINSLFKIGVENLVTNLSVKDMNDLIKLFLFNDFKIENNKVIGEGMNVDIEYENLYNVSVQLLDPFSLATAKFKISDMLGE